MSSEQTNQSTMNFEGAEYPVDSQGFLTNRMMWSPELAVFMAKKEGIDLNQEHWVIINYFREYYEDYNIPPPMRMVMRIFKKEFGEINANSRYLHSMFAETPTKSASKYGGLPKPKNCK